MPREKPAHQVTVDGFYIDVTEVTNAQFKAFVEATNYVTCLLYTSPSPRDRTRSRMPSSA